MSGQVGRPSTTLAAPPTALPNGGRMPDHLVSQSVGGACAHSLDVHSGHPGRRSLPVRCAFALRASLASRARSWAQAPPTSSAKQIDAGETEEAEIRSNRTGGAFDVTGKLSLPKVGQNANPARHTGCRKIE